MMRVHLRRVTCALAIIFLAKYCVGADLANLQLVVASPDPVQAGTAVTFQVIVVNAGNEVWEAKGYMVEAELYGLKKEYLLKSDRVFGRTKVNPGGKSLMFVPLTVPEYFSGIYYYRIYVVHGTERIYSGSLAPIRVNPLPILPPKPPAVKLGGNTIFSYKSDSSNDWKDYTGNVSINLVGRVLDRSILFNLYTIHDQDDAVDIYTILFNYYGSWVQIAFGDILPEFSELSVYGTSMRGVSWENQANNFKTQFVGARVIESEEGTIDTDGVYRRMLYGGQEDISLPWGLTTGLHGQYSADVESSVEIPGPTLTPEKNTTLGGSLNWNGLSFLVLKGQYESSSWTADTTSTMTALTDSAYRADVEIETDPWMFSAYYQRTGPDFVSFGAPEATSDRITLDASTELYLFNFLTLSGGYNKFFDDLEDDPNIVRTTQQITSGGASFNFKSGTGISASYSNNEIIGQDRTIQDNATDTVTASISQSFLGQSISLSRQQSDFKDKTNPDGDLDTATNIGNINCVVGQRFSASLGVSMSDNKMVIAGTNETNDSYMLSFNQVILKDKLTLQVWGTHTLIYNSDLSEDSKETNGNAELTYLVKNDVSVTLGGSRKIFSDVADPSTNTNETGVNVRINYSF